MVYLVLVLNDPPVARTQMLEPCILHLGACEMYNRASKVRWDSIDGELYYILVHGFSAARFGDFQLNIVSAAPLNNLCEKAVEQRLKSQMSFAKTRIILLPNDLTFSDPDET